MKPLLSVISYNRKDETKRTIKSLCRWGAFDQANVIIWDNGSKDGTDEMLVQLMTDGLFNYQNTRFMADNIGCPKALNKILAMRNPGQDFIKVDNDVEVETPDFVDLLVVFLDTHPEVAMASPWYEELETSNQGRVIERHIDWWEVFPVVGHCCIHRGTFMDQTGYFDVLGKDHLYGFEDLLMAHRAGAAGFKCAIVPSVTVRMIQRHNSLDTSHHEGERRAAHVERLRPEYERRIGQIGKLGEYYMVDENGYVRARTNG